MLDTLYGMSEKLGLEEKAPVETVTYGLEDAIDADVVMGDMLEEADTVYAQSAGLENAVKIITVAEPIVSIESDALTGDTIDPSVARMSVAHTLQVAAMLGIPQDQFKNVGVEDIAEDAKTVLEISNEEKSEMLKKAMNSIINMFKKLWNGVKKVTAKAITLMTDTEKKYKATLTMLEGKQDKVQDGEAGNLTDADAKAIYMRLPVLFAEGKKFSSASIATAKELVGALGGVPTMTTTLFDSITSAHDKAIGAVKGEDSAKIVEDLKKEASTFAANYVKPAGEMTALMTRLVKATGAELKSQPLAIVRLDGKAVKVFGESYTAYIKGDGGVTTETYGTKAAMTEGIKDKDVIFIAPTFVKDALALKIDENTNYKDNVDLLSLGDVKNFLATVAPMSTGFKKFSDEAMKPGEGMEKTIKDGTAGLTKMAQTADKSEDANFKSVAKAIESGSKKTLASISVTTSSLTLDMVLGYLGLFRSVLFITNTMGGKYMAKA